MFPQILRYLYCVQINPPVDISTPHPTREIADDAVNTGIVMLEVGINAGNLQQKLYRTGTAYKCPALMHTHTERHSLRSNFGSGS